MRTPVIPSVLLGVAVAVGCSSADGTGQGTPPVPWADLTAVKDTNPDPKVVEVSIEAGETTKEYLPGTRTKVLAYNGTVPGPIIEANAGDKLVVHLENSLSTATTIHWHGVRVPNDMDGAPSLQAPVQPGQSFDYTFTLPDAGLFWFHPHVMEEVQIHQGLFGVIRVRGQSEPKVDDERVVVLDDVLLDKTGAFPTTIDSDTEMVGREGTVLVNGAQKPLLEWRAGALQRLRFVNVANARFFNLALAGYTFRVIGTDGGLMPQPYDTERLLVAPGERYDVVLIPKGQAGDEVVLTSEPYDRGHDTGKAKPVELATLRISTEAPLSGRVLPSAFPEIERLPGGPVDRTITFDEKFVDGHPTFTVDGMTYPDVPPIDVPNGSVHVLDLVNDAEMDHPFHLHGFFFQVLAQNGVEVAPERLANKDTMILPQKSTTRVVVRFDRPGMWMYHCHILEHVARGMMGEIHVEP
ncbi:MAG: multicopper oxidase family protein [Minicystis sp.]